MTAASSLTTPRAPAGEISEFEHNGLNYRCRLLPSPRNRNIRMRLVNEGDAGRGPAGTRALARLEGWHGHLPGFDPRAAFVVRVSFPPRISRRRVLETVRQHLDWIEEQILKSMQAPPPVGKQALVTGTRIFYRGRKLVLYVLPLARKKPVLLLAGDKLVCHTRRTRQADLKRMLERWYRVQAEALIGERIRALAPSVTRQPYRVVIRTQKSRWGSCSESRTLSFNWKLAMTPDFVLNYVLVHELGHLEEMNHSARFWQLVRRNCPYCDAAKKWLRRHGPELEW